MPIPNTQAKLEKAKRLFDNEDISVREKFHTGRWVWFLYKRTLCSPTGVEAQMHLEKDKAGLDLIEKYGHKVRPGNVYF